MDSERDRAEFAEAVIKMILDKSVVIFSEKSGERYINVYHDDFGKCHYFQQCISAVKRFLISAPEEACADPQSDENTQNETEIVQNEPENAQNETEIAQNEPENDQIDPAAGKAGKRKRIDIGKIMALRNANWQVKDIADEMHLTPLQVSQAIYNYKKKHAQKVEE